MNPRHNLGAIGETIVRWPRVLTHILTEQDEEHRRRFLQSREPYYAPVRHFVKPVVAALNATTAAAAEATARMKEFDAAMGETPPPKENSPIDVIPTFTKGESL